MRTKQLAILAVVALAGVAIATVVTSRKPSSGASESAAAEGGRFFPDLAARVNDVAEMRVQVGAKPEGVLTFRRTDAGAWEVVERGGFPAKFEKVKEVVVAIADLARLAPLTSKPERYSALSVQNPAEFVEPEGGVATAPTLITLKDAKGAEMASLIVGATKWGQRPTVYVRKPSEAQSWEASGRVDAPQALAQWVEAEIVRVPRERIALAAVTQRDGSALVVRRDKPGDENFAVQNPPEGKKLRGPSVGDPLGAALASVTLEDAAALSSIDFTGAQGGTPGPTSEFRTFDGLVIFAELLDRDGKTWAKLAASFDESVKAPEGAAGLKTPDEVKAEVGKLNAVFSRFAVQLPSWKAGVFKTTMAEMLEETPPALPPALQQEGNTVVPALPVNPPEAPRP